MEAKGKKKASARLMTPRCLMPVSKAATVAGAVAMKHSHSLCPVGRLVVHASVASIASFFVATICKIRLFVQLLRSGVQ